MDEKTVAYRGMMAAVEALAEECASERRKRGGAAGEITDEELATITEQVGRPLTDTELTAVKLTFASVLAR